MAQGGYYFYDYQQHKYAIDLPQSTKVDTPQCYSDHVQRWIQSAALPHCRTILKNAAQT